MVIENKIVHGNCLDVMKTVERESIHLTFTSPPYMNCKKYSQYENYEIYLNFLRKVFTEVYRITMEGRFLIINISPVLQPRLSRSHQSFRFPIPFDLHPILHKIGWVFTEDIVWEKPNESVKNRNGGFSQHRKPLAYKPNIVTEYILVYRKETNKLIDWNLKQYEKDIVEQSLVKDDYEKTNVWRIHPSSSKKHPAIFPESLCERVIKYYSYVGDIVLDPFMGSGTCCKVAKQLNRKYFGIEQNYDYFCTAENNLK